MSLKTHVVNPTQPCHTPNLSSHFGRGWRPGSWGGLASSVQPRRPSIPQPLVHSLVSMPGLGDPASHEARRPSPLFCMGTARLIQARARSGASLLGSSHRDAASEHPAAHLPCLGGTCPQSLTWDVGLASRSLPYHYIGPSCWLPGLLSGTFRGVCVCWIGIWIV